MSSSDGLCINHEYQDMRGLDLADLRDILEFETEAFDGLHEQNFSEAAVEAADEAWIESFLLPGIDFGVGSTVTALSALGCVPITSCRGNSLDDGHRHDAPTVCFYCVKAFVPMLIRFAEVAGVSIQNNLDMIEVYSADLRSLPVFAREIAVYLEAHQV